MGAGVGMGRAGRGSWGACPFSTGGTIGAPAMPQRLSFVACVLAGAIGVAAGRTGAAGDRQPRVAVVAGAREVVTIPTLSAPEKATDFEPEPQPQPALVPVPRPARSRHVARPRTATLGAPAPLAPPPVSPGASGFGHLGSDRR